ncbi:MAG TPA: 1-acyl-sn-glycerol-3-phosphate acyltransferase [Longimicrobiaceae bacterium]|nr:1-acyl-sn-glycerol-3-phosphate acyltransferase [Longimicrobiaceae bacterium]
MTADIVLPLWLFALLVALALAAVLDRLLVPSVRWFLRQRTLRVIDEVNTRLRIEIRPFQRTRRQVLIDRLMYDSKVQEAVEEHVREQGVPRDVLMQRVERYAREIVPAFNAYAYFRLGYAVARRVARTLYRVRLGYSNEDGLAAIRPGSTVVFVMNHRSNMDYVLVGYLAAKRAALSYAVGEWARIWPLQTLIRSMGAYFVRRNSGDPLYRRVLERYVCMATAAGVTQALYPEGGLTRDGRLRAPKLGLLDYILRGYEASSGERDLVFVPVGINYDRTLEDRSLLLALDASAPRPGRVGAVAVTLRFLCRNLLLALRRRWYRLGYACVNFGSPISVRNHLADRGIELAGLPRDDRRALVESIGDDLMEAVGAVVPVLPVPLVATAFVAEPNRSWSRLELKARVFELIEQLEAAGAHLYVPRRDADYAIEVGLRMLVLRHLVNECEGLFRPVRSELPLLAYYANSIEHLREAPPRESAAAAAALPLPHLLTPSSPPAPADRT